MVDLPPVPTISIPPVPNPVCADHCSGNHTVEASLVCPVHGPSYHLVSHEWFHMAGHYFYSTEAVNGARTLARREKPSCRECGGPLKRVER
jgi:hypothetical protein